MLPAGGGGVGVVGSVCKRCQWCCSRGGDFSKSFLPSSWSSRHQENTEMGWLSSQACAGWCTRNQHFYNGSRFPSPRESQQLLGVSDSLTDHCKSPCWILKRQLMDILMTQHESVQLGTESGSPNIPMKLFLWRLQSALERFKVLTRIIQWWYQCWHDTVPMWPGTSPFRDTLHIFGSHTEIWTGI